LGLCERCNYVKEVAGWIVKPNVDEIGRHTAEFITPTGAHYRSAAPARAPTITTSDVEVRIGIALARHAA
ncbi:MAG: HNH endonuclease, partial [Mycobacterium sp.]